MAWDCEARRDTVRLMVTRRRLLERSAAAERDVDAAFPAVLGACSGVRALESVCGQPACEKIAP
jgi:hypothetical protein